MCILPMGRLRAAYVDAEKIMAVDSKGKLIAKKYGPETES